MDKLKEKRDYVLNVLASGISIERAFILANCLPDEIEELQNDTEFVGFVKYTEAKRELDLLSMHQKASEIAASRGNATPLQWKLERLNPDRWGTKQNVIPITTINPHTITDEILPDMSEEQLLEALSQLEGKD